MYRKGQALRTGPRVYKVVEQIGEGGRGFVYEVKDEWGQRFALKQLKPEFAGTKAETRFMKE